MTFFLSLILNRVRIHISSRTDVCLVTLHFVPKVTQRFLGMHNKVESEDSHPLIQQQLSREKMGNFKMLNAVSS